MKDIRIWITYHKEEQIRQFNLHEDEIFCLYKGDELSIKGDNINDLNPFYSEIVTLYWVWKNRYKSNRVGFCHYRRLFQRILDINKGQCQVMTINRNFPVLKQYKMFHNYQDYYDIIDIMQDFYGKGNKYSTYMIESQTFVPFCSFIMVWEDFCNLCEFLFPILFEFDHRNHLNMNPKNYINKAIRDFRYEDINYQCRAISFLAERIISCFLVCEMNSVSIDEL